MTDAAYSMPMQMLIGISIFVESEIRGDLINFVATLKLEDAELADRVAEKALQSIANIQAGWRETVEAMGIDPAAMAKAGMQSHSAFELISDFIPEPEAEGAKAWREVFEGLLKQAAKS